jgi:hypothetical protein
LFASVLATSFTVSPRLVREVVLPTDPAKFAPVWRVACRPIPANLLLYAFAIAYALKASRDQH